MVCLNNSILTTISKKIITDNKVEIRFKPGKVVKTERGVFPNIEKRILNSVF